MTIIEAREMIRFRPQQPDPPPEHWADLGCGAGTFTRALAELLSRGSRVTAVDKNAAILKELPPEANGVPITPVAAESGSYLKNLQNLDGVLMANALHFIADQKTFLLSLKECLRP